MQKEIEKLNEKIDLLIESVQRNIEYCLYEVVDTKKVLKLQEVEKELLKNKELIRIAVDFKNVALTEELEQKLLLGIKKE